jgi:NTE family protein
MDKTRAFGIFEGGGAKGLAHPGAYKAAERRFEFVGVAGTSAGAIMAALVAAGYGADQVYEPHDPNSLFQMNLLELFDKQEWKNLERLRTQIDRKSERNKRIKDLVWAVIESSWTPWLNLLAGAMGTVALIFFGFNWWLVGDAIALAICFAILSRYRTILKLTYRFLQYEYSGHTLLLSNFGAFRILATKRGVLDTATFRNWLNEKLRAKINERFPDSTIEGDVLFKHIPIALKIIAAEHDQKVIRVFSNENDPDLPVADAVCGSISIPFVFIPKKIYGVEFVDGGMMSNFPAWVFDEELKNEARLTPVIGFRLVGGASPAKDEEEIFLHYTQNVLHCALFGDNGLQTRKVGNLKEILLPVKIGTLAFDADPITKSESYLSAYKAAEAFLSDSGNAAPASSVKKILKLAKGVLEKKACLPGVHLRLCVMMPVSSTSLGVVYTLDMDSDEDTDDQLVLGFDQGAAGECWRSKRPIDCNLLEASLCFASRWNLNKRQQKLIRSDLKSLLCIPIRKLQSDSLIGVLCIDSNVDINSQLRSLIGENDHDLYTITDMLANRLVTWGLS